MINQTKLTALRSVAFFSTFFLIQNVFTQGIDRNVSKRFAAIAGINFSNMNFNKGYPEPTAPIQASWRAAAEIGFILVIPLVESLSLQPGYCYTQRNGSNASSLVSYKFQYFSFPLLLKYQLSRRFSILAGPRAELLIRANSQGTGGNLNITHDVEERSIAMSAGVDAYLVNPFFISFRYLQGLNHIGIGQRSSVQEFKYEAASVSVGVVF